jgi:hypothetical protein
VTETFKLVLGKPTIDKDPQAELDYFAGFREWLDFVSDTILSHTITKTVGVTVMSSGIVNASKDVAIWASGGTKGKPAYVTVKITTVAGRKDERTLYFNIVDR